MKETQNNRDGDDEFAELDQKLAEAKRLLREARKPTPLGVELIGRFASVLVIVGIALVLHHMFPAMGSHDLRLWGFAALVVIIVIVVLWTRMRR